MDHAEKQRQLSELTELHTKNMKSIKVIIYLVTTTTVFELLQMLVEFIPPARILKFFGIHGTQIFLVCTVLLMGFGAAVFKKKAQFYYGWCELIFASVSTLWIVRGLPTSNAVLSQWTALIGSAYIVARGMGNISDAKIKEQSEVKS